MSSTFMTARLPLRFQTEPGSEPVLSVDGAFGAPGLNLSHWPGNNTPQELKHDLSVGCVLAFHKQPAARQKQWLGDAQAIVINHLDTDGLCSMFAASQPEAALALEAELCAASRAGDLFEFPSETAMAVDLTVTAMIDAERSPWAAEWRGLDEAARHQRAVEAIVPLIPELVTGAALPRYEALWKADLEDLLSDRKDLTHAQRDHLVHFGCAILSGLAGVPSSRTHKPSSYFDPGRHPLTEVGDDRILCIGPGAAGTTYRFIIGTSSWFELVTRTAQARPNLVALVAQLNELERVAESAEVRWHTQDVTNPAPELWFGRAGQPSFAEHNGLLCPSSLAPEQVKRLVIDALRAAFVFPED